MQYVILIVILFFLIWKLIQIVVNATWSLRTYQLATFSWKQTGLFLGAIAVIVATEMIAPSLRLTGMVRSTEITPPDHLSTLPFSDGPVTYAEFSRAAPYLWRLGEISRSDMQARLDADIALAEAKLEDVRKRASTGRISNSKRPTNSPFARLMIRKTALWEAMVTGLISAKDDLGTLFETESVPVVLADRFVLDHIWNVLEDHIDKTQARQFQISRLVAARKQRLTEEELPDDPEYQALIQEHSETEVEERALEHAAEPFAWLNKNLPRLYVSRLETDYFPSYPHPLIITSDTASSPLRHDRAVTAPPSKIGARLYAQLSDALTGRLRHPERGKILLDCGIAIRAGKAEPFCLTSQPLAVNYDVSAANCATPDADGLCLEHWIFPYLSVRFTPDAITFFPPHAKGRDIPSDLTTWSVVWDGTTHALDAPLTLPWSGDPDELRHVRLTHGPRSDAVLPGFWQDIRKRYPGDTLKARASAPEHPFQTQDITDFSDIWSLELNGFLHLLTGDEEAPYNHRVSLETRMDDFKTLSRRYAKQHPFGETLAREYCTDGTDPKSDGQFDVVRAAMAGFVAETGGDTCVAYHGYINLLRMIQRQEVEGSWLWLVSDDYERY